MVPNVARIVCLKAKDKYGHNTQKLSKALPGKRCRVSKSSTSVPKASNKIVPVQEIAIVRNNIIKRCCSLQCCNEAKEWIGEALKSNWSDGSVF